MYLFCAHRVECSFFTNTMFCLPNVKIVIKSHKHKKKIYFFSRASYLFWSFLQYFNAYQIHFEWIWFYIRNESSKPKNRYLLKNARTVPILGMVTIFYKKVNKWHFWENFRYFPFIHGTQLKTRLIQNAAYKCMIVWHFLQKLRFNAKLL